MPARIIDGKAIAKRILERLKPDVEQYSPKLMIVQVGNDDASAIYIERKLEACKNIGMKAELISLDASTSYEDLHSHIETLNANPEVTGFIVQLPLPAHLMERLPCIYKSIDPKKDVDGFTAYNLGKVFLSKDFEDLPPATPAGVALLLEEENIDVSGKHVVIVGRSNIVGKPLAVMLLNRDATVTICHSKTPNLAEYTSQADILICAAGKPGLITASHVKKDAVVIDIGTTKEGGSLVGDVDFDSVETVASAITPVPGGIGPMTVASLLQNCAHAARRTKR